MASVDPLRPLKRPSVSDDGIFDPVPSTSVLPGSSTNGTANKRRITRKRAILSCGGCTQRKIKCEREGTGACKACTKRGETGSCDAGGGQTSLSTSPGGVLPSVHDSCAEHRSSLERRVEVLEKALLARRPSLCDSFSIGGRSFRGGHDTPDTDVEDAAMTLEDIAVNVRLTQAPQTRRAGPAFTPASTYIAPLPPPAGQTREFSSLLAPPISKRFRGVLTDLYELLPERQRMDWLIERYFGSVSWFWAAHHQPTFRREYKAFHTLLDSGRQVEIDPLFLAVLFLTLAHAVGSLDYLPPGAPYDAASLGGLSCSYFEAARAALDCGDAFGVARLRTVQAVVLLAPLALNSGKAAQVDILNVYLAATIRLAQNLQLHQLGNDPSRMPPEDPMLPSGTNTLRREIALRLFHSLLHVDQITLNCKPILPMELVTSSYPGNYNDADLSPDGLVRPQPDSVRTAVTYERIRSLVGIVQRRFQDDVASDPSSIDYSTVLQCDMDLRGLIQQYELTRPDPHESTTALWSRLLSRQNIEIRRIRINRPFVSKGYRDASYRPSTDAALDAARAVLTIQQSLDQTNAPLVKDCYHLNHLQVAAVVLFIDIWQNYDPENATPSADYRLVNDAASVFHRALTSSRERVRVVARQSTLVIQCLFEALHARTSSTRKEPFAQLLKRVSVAIADGERRASSEVSGTTIGLSSMNGAPTPPSSNFGTILTLPAPDPVTGDGRSLLLDFASSHYESMPFFPTTESVHSASTPSFSPPSADLQFELTNEFGFSWLSGLGAGYA